MTRIQVRPHFDRFTLKGDFEIGLRGQRLPCPAIDEIRISRSKAAGKRDEHLLMTLGVIPDNSGMRPNR